MARPVTKDGLITQAEENYTKLMALIDSFSVEEQLGEFPFEGRDRQIRDCLTHLIEWHNLFIVWVKSNHSGDPAPFLPEPYNWKNYPEMNVMFWQKHQKTTLHEARELFITTYKECLFLINQFSDEALFTKKYFKWTGTTSLGSYAISATSSHYDWAFKIINRYKKSRLKP